MQADVERRWLDELNPTTVNLHWQLNRNFARSDTTPQQLFQERLLDNMYDAVIFVDVNRQIMLWNRGAERLTGIDAASAYQRIFEAELINLRTERGDLCTGDECPATTALRTGMQSVRRLLVGGSDQRDIMVDAQTIPIAADDGTPRGVAIVLHDASGQVSLEERCLNLHQKATRDPLTQLSNRAEFDRVLTLFVDVHLERRMPCSLIIGDIDRFKQVNDNYGHQAGDEAIKSFAQILKTYCKPGDLAVPLRRRGVCAVVCQLQQRHRRRTSRTTPPPIRRVAPARPWRRLHHCQLRRHRTTTRRHARDHAPPGRPRTFGRQRYRPQQSHPTRWRRRTTPSAEKSLVLLAFHPGRI